ncbi:hypothetical protein [Arthrobacter sp. KK5.5]|uniref:hypothetical protein n=1 Tax=Arthrobacter sp. KK5.5 TaxID=3373084 RepID=UPI003EE7A156
MDQGFLEVLRHVQHMTGKGDVSFPVAHALAEVAVLEPEERSKSTPQTPNPDALSKRYAREHIERLAKDWEFDSGYGLPIEHMHTMGRQRRESHALVDVFGTVPGELLTTDSPFHLIETQEAMLAAIDEYRAASLPSEDIDDDEYWDSMSNFGPRGIDLVVPCWLSTDGQGPRKGAVAYLRDAFDGDFACFIPEESLDSDNIQVVDLELGEHCWSVVVETARAGYFAMHESRVPAHFLDQRLPKDQVTSQNRFLVHLYRPGLAYLMTLNDNERQGASLAAAIGQEVVDRRRELGAEPLDLLDARGWERPDFRPEEPTPPREFTEAEVLQRTRTIQDWGVNLAAASAMAQLSTSGEVVGVDYERYSVDEENHERCKRAAASLEGLRSTIGEYPTEYPESAKSRRHAVRRWLLEYFWDETDFVPNDYERPSRRLRPHELKLFMDGARKSDEEWITEAQSSSIAASGRCLSAAWEVWSVEDCTTRGSGRLLVAGGRLMLSSFHDPVDLTQPTFLSLDNPQWEYVVTTTKAGFQHMGVPRAPVVFDDGDFIDSLIGRRESGPYIDAYLVELSSPGRQIHLWIPYNQWEGAEVAALIWQAIEGARDRSGAPKLDQQDGANWTVSE